MNKGAEIGASLIEVLIAISILSFGVLGTAGMQTSAVANTHLAHQYSQAALLAQSIAEEMRSNQAAVTAGLYQHSADVKAQPPGKNCSASICTSSELAAWDIATWDSILGDSGEESLNNHPDKLPLGLAGGKLSIACQETCGNHSIQVITIHWDARRNGATGIGCNPSSESDLACFRLAYAP